MEPRELARPAPETAMPDGERAIAVRDIVAGAGWVEHDVGSLRGEQRGRLEIEDVGADFDRREVRRRDRAVRAGPAGEARAVLRRAQVSAPRRRACRRYEDGRRADRSGREEL